MTEKGMSLQERKKRVQQLGSFHCSQEEPTQVPQGSRVFQVGRQWREGQTAG
jgi:hypothetical protein